MPQAHINRIATAVPDHEVHDYFLRFAGANLAGKPRERAAFEKMASRSGIERRYSCISPAADPEGESVDTDGFFPRGAFPGTGARMEFYDRHAGRPRDAGDRGAGPRCGAAGSRIWWWRAAPGMSAPGLDLEIVQRAGLSPSVERTLIGFMGCYAAINALKQAHHIVRSDPSSRVLVVNCELCTLHLKETRRSRAAADLQPLGRRGVGGAGHGRCRGARARRVQRAAGAGRPRPDDLARARRRLRHGAVGAVPGAIREVLGAHRRDGAERRGAGGDRALGGASGRAVRSRRGRADAGSRHRTLWPPRGRSCAVAATCPRPR